MWSPLRLWAVLFSLAVLAFTANLFGPAARWWGVDLGASGAAVFHLALIGSVILVALRPREVIPEAWSVAEGRAWLGLVFMTMILLAFAKLMWLLSTLAEVPATPAAVPARHFLWELVVLFIAWRVTSSLLGRGAGPIELDERDLRMRNRADRAGDWALSLTVIECVVLLAWLPATTLAWWLEPMILAHALIGFLIVKALVEHAALVAGYTLARR